MSWDEKGKCRTDEIKACTTVVSQVRHNQINLAVHSAQGRVERARPDLGVGSELEGGLVNKSGSNIQLI